MGLLDEGVVDAPEAEEVLEPAVEHTEGTLPEGEAKSQGEDAPKESLPVDAPVQPEWCPDSFWDPLKGADAEKMAKSYHELRNAFNKKNNDTIGETTDAYMLPEFFSEEGNFKAEGLVVPKDDPMLQAAYKAAQESGLGVKATNEFISKFMGEAAAFAPPAIDVEAEIKSLGKNASHVIAGIKTWIDGLESNGSIDAEVKAKMVELGATAAGIKALDVMRQRSGEQALPTQEAITGTQNMTADDWYKATYETHGEHGESREQYNKRMRTVGEKIFGNGHGTFNGSGMGVR